MTTNNKWIKCFVTAASFSVLASAVSADMFDELEEETSTSSPAPKQQAVKTIENQTDDAFESLDFETQYGTSSQSKSELDEEFQSWKKTYFEELDRYKKEILNIWDEAEVTEKTQWVEYSEDMKTKKVIDYEKNEIRISFVGEQAGSSEQIIEKAVQEIIQTTPNEARKSDPVLTAISADKSINDSVNNESMLSELMDVGADSEEKPVPQSKAAPSPGIPTVTSGQEQTRNDKNLAETQLDKVPANLVDAPSVEGSKDKKIDQAIASDESNVEIDESVVAENIDAENIDAENIDAENTAEVSNATLASPSMKEEREQQVVESLVDSASIAKPEPQVNTKLEPVTTITIKLPSQTILKRAQKYSDYVDTYAKKNKLEKSLVYAVMHTESAFNPLARSAIPAFGLMQIVPSSAGRDVAQRIYGEDRIFPAEYLYDAKNNVEAGSTYLNILYYSYLKKIEDPLSRLYCAVAAYNTGAGNVSVAFIGNRKLSKAVPVINSKSPAEVYKVLHKKLPYDETRMYLERVIERKKMYDQHTL